MIYFIADSHSGHDREFIYKQRGFNSIQEHDEALLDGINYTVKQTDTLYILGDIAWVNPVKFLNSIYCEHIFVIKGNHDKDLYNQKGLLKRNITLCNELLDIKINGQKITLSHFPMISWEASHYNSWLIYGHVHGKKLPIDGKMFDVAPRKEHIQPYSFDEIVEIMKTKPNNWDYIKRCKSECGLRMSYGVSCDKKDCEYLK